MMMHSAYPRSGSGPRWISLSLGLGIEARISMVFQTLPCGPRGTESAWRVGRRVRRQLPDPAASSTRSRSRSGVSGSSESP